MLAFASQCHNFKKSNAVYTSVILKVLTANGFRYSACDSCDEACSVAADTVTDLLRFGDVGRAWDHDTIVT